MGGTVDKQGGKGRARYTTVLVLETKNDAATGTTQTIMHVHGIPSKVAPRTTGPSVSQTMNDDQIGQ